ncbi:MAG TPA: hypothetical protein VEP30_12365 [Chthoniobacterales bacterium]|nr:hypothetical protein [Chthoniobacterales bacterium]
MREQHARISLLLCAIVITTVNGQNSATKKEDDLVLVDGPNFVLPSRVGPFNRGDAQLVDKNAYDFAFSYDLDHWIKCEIAAHPAGTRGYGSDLKTELQLQQNAISRANRDVKLVSREPAGVTQDDRAVAGLRATYNLQYSLFANRNLDCGLQLYVFRDGPWFVVYRFFYPRSKSADAVKQIASFLASWQWRQIPRHIP